MIRIFRVLIPASILVLFISEAILIMAVYALSAKLLDVAEPLQWNSIIRITVLILAGMYLSRMYVLRIRGRLMLIQSLLMVMGFVLIAQSLFKYLNLDWAIPQDVLGTLLVGAILFGWRLLFETAMRNKIGLKRMLFWGCSPIVRGLMEHLNQHPELGFIPVGYLDTQNPPDLLSRDAFYLGTAEQFNQLMEVHRPDWIVINDRSDIRPEQIQYLIELRFGGVETVTAAMCYEMIFGRLCAARIQPRELFFTRHLQPDPLNLRLQAMWTRIVALVTLPITIPLFGMLAVLTWANSRQQPVLIRETKVGFQGMPLITRRFRYPKQGRLAALLGWLGLGKLPQVWNVLLGQMSFVGPDADTPEFAAWLNKAIPFHSQRTNIRPGLTGWAQINQRLDGSQGDAIRRTEYDLYYLQNLTPMVDLFILVRWLRDKNHPPQA